jgi:hypothetical protein
MAAAVPLTTEMVQTEGLAVAQDILARAARQPQTKVQMGVTQDTQARRFQARAAAAQAR